VTIDWLTVGAQAINFLVLVYLLQHFLYHPVINAMDRRERRIAEEMAEAEQREAAADREAARFREMQRALDEERTKRLEAAEREAEQRRQELLEQAREEVRRAREQWQSDLAREQTELERSVRHAAADAVARISRRVLAELADAGLEARMAERFLARLGDMDAATRTALQGAQRLTVRTAFEAGPEVAERLRDGIGRHLGRATQLDFQRADDLLCGIELAGAGRKVGWSVDQYLGELSGALDQALAGRGPGAGDGAGRR